MEKAISFFFFLFLIFFPFGQLTSSSAVLNVWPEVRIYLTDVTVFFMVFSWLVWRLLLNRKSYHFPPLGLPILVFFGLALLSWIANLKNYWPDESIIASLYLVRWIFYAGLFFAIADFKQFSKDLEKDNLYKFLALIGTFIGVFGFIQYLLWPNLKPLEYLGWDPHYYRLVGTFLDPGFTGIILVLTLMLLISFSNKSLNYWLLLAGLLNLAALILTQSRASWLALLAGLTVFTFKERKPIFLVGFALVVALAVFLMPKPAGEGGKIERTYTVSARLQNWQNTFEIFKTSPILGVGFDTLRYIREKNDPMAFDSRTNHAAAGSDSSLLFVLATTGLVGFFGYLWLWKKVISRGSTVVVCSVAALFFHSFFLNSLFYPWVMAWMWILLAKENN